MDDDGFPGSVPSNEDHRVNCLRILDESKFKQQKDNPTVWEMVWQILTGVIIQAKMGQFWASSLAGIGKVIVIILVLNLVGVVNGQEFGDFSPYL